MVKVKIPAKSPEAYVGVVKKPEEKKPVVPQAPAGKKKKEKGLIGKMIFLIRSDVHKKIEGNGKLDMTKLKGSDESWKDWEGQL